MPGRRKDFLDNQTLRDFIKQASQAEEALKSHQAALGFVADHNSRALQDFIGQVSQAEEALKSQRAALGLIGGHSQALQDFAGQATQAHEALKAQQAALGVSSHQTIQRMLDAAGFGRFDAVARDYAQTFSELTRAAESFQSAFRPLVGDLPFAFSELSLAGSFDRRLWADVVTAPSLADALPSFPELEALQRTVERYQDEILAAEDENARRKRLSAFLTQAAEGLIGLDLSPEKRLKLFFQLIRMLIALLLWVQNVQQAQIIKTKDVELRRVQREHGQTLTVLAETVRQLQEQLAAARNTQAILRVSKPSILRDGPSGSSARVAKLTAGTRLRFVTAVDRWYYVDQLDDRSGAVLRSGWIYRRNAEVIR